MGKGFPPGPLARVRARLFLCGSHVEQRLVHEHVLAGRLFHGRPCIRVVAESLRTLGDGVDEVPFGPSAILVGEQVEDVVSVLHREAELSPDSTSFLEDVGDPLVLGLEHFPEQAVLFQDRFVALLTDLGRELVEVHVPAVLAGHHPGAINKRDEAVGADQPEGHDVPGHGPAPGLAVPDVETEVDVIRLGLGPHVHLVVEDCLDVH